MIKNIQETKLDGVKVIELDFLTTLEDHTRKLTIRKNIDSGLDVNFVQDDISISKYKVLRGLHGDIRTWKLISCLQGEFFSSCCKF